MAASSAVTVQDDKASWGSASSAMPSGQSLPSLGGWTLKKKMWLTLALMWLVMIGIVVSMAWQSRNTMYEDRQQALTDIVKLAQGIVASYADRARQGELELETAQQRAFDTIKQLRFGADDDNYVFAFDGDARILSHPRRPRGEDVSGASTYSAMLQEAQQNGSGFVSYEGHFKEGSDKLAEKLSYVSHFKPWDTILVAGEYINDIDEEVSRLLLQFGVILLLAGGLVTVVFTMLIRNVYSSLGGEPSAAVDVVGRIADGDLTRKTPLRDGDTGSLMYAIERMRVELGGTIARIRRASESIDTGTREIATGNNDLSARTEEQAASLAETAASMEQLTSTVSQNADNAGQANRLAAQTTESVASGQEVISRVVTTMGDIRESSGKIADIITLIDGIAFQTNLLALNASVEAARAGEQGRGFAVVASEVRNLAGRSAKAASDIKALIESSVGQVNTGAKLVDQADSAMSEIRESAQRVSDLMGEISAASHEQSSGIEQVSQAVTQMDQVTQQNAALVQQAAAAAGSLEDQSGQLYEAVVRFRVADNA